MGCKHDNSQQHIIKELILIITNQPCPKMALPSAVRQHCDYRFQVSRAIGHSSADTGNCEGLCDAEMVRNSTQVTLKILLNYIKTKGVYTVCHNKLNKYSSRSRTRMDLCRLMQCCATFGLIYSKPTGCNCLKKEKKRKKKHGRSIASFPFNLILLLHYSRSLFRTHTNTLKSRWLSEISFEANIIWKMHSESNTQFGNGLKTNLTEMFQLYTAMNENS